MSAEGDAVTECRHGGCPRSDHAEGWCAQHWGRVRDGRPVEDPQRRPDGRCARARCDRKTRTKRSPYCRGHDYRDVHGLKMEQPSDRPASPASAAACPRCELAPWARGLCAPHYTAAWKAGKLTGKDAKALGPTGPAECAHCHAVKRIKSRGLCSKCHMAATRAGVLDEVAAAPRRRRRVTEAAGIIESLSASNS